jgi:hypothetical protein
VCFQDADDAELSTLVILSLAYMTLRERHIVPPGPSSPNPQQRRSPTIPWLRPKRTRSLSPRSVDAADDLSRGIGGRGCIWGTEEREYR